MAQRESFKSNNSSKWALILVGGFGTRLQSILPNLPKVLAPIGERCFLDYQLDYVKSQGINTVILCTGYLSDQIKLHTGTGEKAGLKVYYSEEEEPLDTAGAIRKACEAFDLPETFFALNGDTYVRWNSHRMYSALVVPHTDLVMTLVRASTGAMGNVELGENSQVTRFVEKEVLVENGFANAGVYLIRRDIVKSWPPGRLSIEYDCLPSMGTKGAIQGVVIDSPLYDIGTPEGLQAFEKALSEIESRGT